MKRWVGGCSHGKICETNAWLERWDIGEGQRQRGRHGTVEDGDMTDERGGGGDSCTFFPPTAPESVVCFNIRLGVRGRPYTYTSYPGKNTWRAKKKKKKKKPNSTAFAPSSARISPEFCPKFPRILQPCSHCWCYAIGGGAVVYLD